MDGHTRVAIVTGANGAIGRAIATGMAERNFAVVLVCRDRKRGEQALEYVRERSGRPAKQEAARLEIADVSRSAEVLALAQRWQGPLHVLINNAALAPRQRQETPEGIETQFATNVLGYLWMTQTFAPVLQACRPARVVNVASYWAGDLDLDDLEFRRRPYDNNTAYRQSKQADRMLTVALARRLANTGITVNACHPGDANSRLSNDLGFGGSDTPEGAAETPIWLASSPALSGTSGCYFAHEKQVTCAFSHDSVAIDELYDLCYQRLPLL
jgi:NAD(P)-dependent dehydrogenase (short-subunit alcohol dehydrogenase family)